MSMMNFLKPSYLWNYCFPTPLPTISRSQPLGTNAWNALKIIGSGMWNAGIFTTTLQIGLPVACLSYTSYRLGKKAITSKKDNVKVISTIGSALAGIWGVAELYKGYNILSCAATSNLATSAEIFACCMA